MAKSKLKSDKIKELLESTFDELDESIIELNETESFNETTSKRSITDQEDEIKRPVPKKQRKMYTKESTDDDIEIDEESNDEDYDVKSSKKKPSQTKKRTKKKSDLPNTDDEEDDQYDVKRSSRNRKKTAGKKDDWNDDESHQSISSCELSSDSKEFDDVAQTKDSDILEFFNNASVNDIQSLINIIDSSVKKLVSMRPYDDIKDLKTKLSSNRLNHTFISAQEALYARDVVNNLLEKCKKISQGIKKNVEKITKQSTDENKVHKSSSLSLKKQPNCLNKKMTMKSYQLIGLNWLCYMYENKLNAVLADEMGLGKTCQTIAFLASLYEKNPKLMHLIVVPASTLENWSREITNWFPSFNYLIYTGNQDERRTLRKQVLALKNKKSAKPLNAILTTYNYIGSKEQDKAFFRSLKLEYCIFDEAHVLKNMKTIRYDNLMKIKSKHKLLLTGTPLQNNLVELMSLLFFITPSTFANRTKFVNKLFLPKKYQNDLDTFYTEKIEQAKGIMDPFILRRLKKDVLKELPDKIDNIVVCKMTPRQEEEYNKCLESYKQKRMEKQNNSGVLMFLTELRKAANHPLLTRSLFTDDKIKEMAHIIMRQSDADTRFDYVVEDMSVMSDFELHQLCPLYNGLENYQLKQKEILNSGKFIKLGEMLNEFKEEGDRVLIFSQFKIMLDIIEEYLNICGHKFLRLDGSTKVEERQGLIDQFNNDKEILVFMLTTKAGGVGINLVGANRVIMHDIDYNPHNDKQAEDRSHRVGQKREVQVYKLISKSTVDETMLKVQVKKLELDADIHGGNHGSIKKQDIMKILNEVLD